MTERPGIRKSSDPNGHRLLAPQCRRFRNDGKADALLDHAADGFKAA
jgi:hypothetical protein